MYNYNEGLDPEENPWLDVLSDEEAEQAYWNTH